MFQWTSIKGHDRFTTVYLDFKVFNFDNIYVFVLLQWKWEFKIEKKSVFAKLKTLIASLYLIRESFKGAVVNQDVNLSIEGHLKLCLQSL